MNDRSASQNIESSAVVLLDWNYRYKFVATNIRHHTEIDWSHTLAKKILSTSEIYLLNNPTSLVLQLLPSCVFTDELLIAQRTIPGVG